MRKINKMMNNKKGFTLIELIIVIAIIGIIAAIAIPKLSGFQDSAKKKADIANAKNIATMISTMVANGDITATVTTVSALPSDVSDKFPNGLKAQTLSGTAYYYTVNVSTGAVAIYELTPAEATASEATTLTSKQLYPTIGSSFN